jgi:hypothetical protein
LTPVPPPEKNARPADLPADPARRARLADLLTELRLGIDLGDIRTPAAFRAMLERDGTFTSDDPLVRSPCASAGLTAWLLLSSG